MTLDEIKALKELEAKATSGTWESNDWIVHPSGEQKLARTIWLKDDEREDNVCIVQMPEMIAGWGTTPEDAHHNLRFIASARNNLPALLAIAEAAIELNDCVNKRGGASIEVLDKLVAAIEGSKR